MVETAAAVEMPTHPQGQYQEGTDEPVAAAPEGLQAHESHERVQQQAFETAGRKFPSPMELSDSAPAPAAATASPSKVRKLTDHC